MKRTAPAEWPTRQPSADIYRELIAPLGTILAEASHPVALAQGLASLLLLHSEETLLIDCTEENHLRRMTVLSKEVRDEQLPLPPAAGTDAPKSQEPPLTHRLSAPLIVQGAPMGTLTLLRPGHAPAWNESDRALAETVARLTAPALDRLLQREHVLSVREFGDELLGIASHELRTPTTALVLQLELLQRDLERLELPASTRAALKARAGKVLNNCRSLVNLETQLLDISRARLGKFSLERREIDLTELVRGVVVRLAAAIAHARCTLETRLDNGVTGVWDPIRLEQVVANLLINATKYASGSHLQIILRAEPEGAMLAVQDDGPGIAPEIQRRLFQRFERGTPILQAGGWGLGLYICRQIIEAHGGTITLESAPGQGSTFCVRLPAASAPAFREPAASSAMESLEPPAHSPIHPGDAWHD